MDDLKTFLISDAKQKGICPDGFSHMSTAADIDTLIAYYLENPDWCLERDYPSLSVLRANFSNIEDRGVFVDHVFSGDTLFDQQVYIFHNCRGNIKVGLNIEKGIIPMLYFANNCDMQLEGIPYLYVHHKINVPIHIFGKNTVFAPNNDSTNFISRISPLI